MGRCRRENVIHHSGPGDRFSTQAMFSAGIVPSTQKVMGGSKGDVQPGTIIRAGGRDGMWFKSGDYAPAALADNPLSSQPQTDGLRAPHAQLGAKLITNADGNRNSPTDQITDRKY